MKNWENKKKRADMTGLLPGIGAGIISNLILQKRIIKKTWNLNLIVMQILNLNSTEHPLKQQTYIFYLKKGLS
jgi:hypothetical protein